MPILAHIPYVTDIDKKERPQYVIDYVNATMRKRFPDFSLYGLAFFVTGTDFPDEIMSVARHWNEELQISLDEACLELKKHPESKSCKERAKTAIDDIADETTKNSMYIVIEKNGKISTRLSRTAYEDVVKHVDEYVKIHTKGRERHD